MVRMMAVGNFEQTSADYIGIAQTTMSKILPQVCDAILKHFDTLCTLVGDHRVDVTS